MTEEKKAEKVEEVPKVEEKAVKETPVKKEEKPIEKKVEKKEEPKEQVPQGNQVIVRNHEETTKGQKNKRGRPRGPRRPRRDDDEKEAWVPKTSIGKRVQSGEITNIDDILEAGDTIMEAGIVDALLPGLSEEVIDVRRVQRTLDSGRRMRFSVLVVVGDKNGHVGVGLAKGVEAGPTIKKSITRAKLNIIKVGRGCSSWECGCGEDHTVPFKVTGKNGSVKVTFKPAPKGVGLVVGDKSKTILKFAGIQDVWGFSRGHTRTTINQVIAAYDALKKLSTFKKEASSKVKTKK